MLPGPRLPSHTHVHSLSHTHTSQSSPALGIPGLSVLWVTLCVISFFIWQMAVWLLEKTIAARSSTLAWKILWMEEPGRLQSMGSQRVGNDWVTSLSLFTFMHWRRKWQLTPVFLPGESQGWGAWWVAVYEVTQSQTRLKRLSSSSSPYCMWIF